MRKGYRLLTLVIALVLTFPVAAWSQDAANPSLEEEVEALKEKVEALSSPDKAINIGGAVRFNYRLNDRDGRMKDRGGDMLFDIFRLNVDGQYNNWLVSAEYRWYSYMDVIHHGWVGYNFRDTTQVQAGVTQVPFGLLPYAANNYWFGVPYYIGMADDYDLGIKLIESAGPLNLQAAFFKNEEWGNSAKLERYSYDVVRALEQENEETNQFNLRLAYTLDHGKLGNTELGVSGMWGQLYNRATEDMGDRWAAAAHVKGSYGGWGLMLQGAYYEFNPKNPEGVSNDTVVMGAFADAYEVAAKGTVLVANLSYTLPVELGPVTALTFYNDYSILMKDESDWTDSQVNTLGVMVSANPVYVYVDLTLGKNMVYLGGPGDALAGGEGGNWRPQFNINVGYYF